MDANVRLCDTLESEDFDAFNEVIDVEAGSEDGCFGVIIWEDNDLEADEQFTITALDVSGNELVATTVTIVNDDINDGMSLFGSSF